MHTKTCSRQAAIEVLRAADFDVASTTALHADHCDGICHLCRVPYFQHLHDCVCPHWLVLPWPSTERMRTVVDAYDIAAILHFLLVYTRPKTSRRLPETDIAVIASASDTELDLLVKAQRRRWVFSLTTEDADAPRLSFRLTAPSKAEFETTFIPKDGDIALLRRFAPT